MTFLACWRKFAETILDVPRLGCLCPFLCFAVDGSVESFRFIACRSCGIEKMVVENGGGFWAARCFPEERSVGRWVDGC